MEILMKRLPEKNVKTGLYARTATPEPDRIRRQIGNLMAFASSKGITNVRCFTDDGYSGANCDRPGFKAMMAAVDAGEIDTIIVTDMTRIARSYDSFKKICDMAQMKGVRLICIMEKIDILPKHIHDYSNDLDYTLHGDYYLPDLIDKDQEDHRPLGKWGMMRMDYLKEHHPGVYTYMLLNGSLHTHLADLDEQARERHERIVKQMAQVEGITEQMKMLDQMAWVGRMNNIAARADEIIRDELIFN